MTEAEWLPCDDPVYMLSVLGDRAGGRKDRLFAVACCHRIGHLISDPRSRRAVAFAEQFADATVPGGDRPGHFSVLVGRPCRTGAGECPARPTRDSELPGVPSETG